MLSISKHTHAALSERALGPLQSLEWVLLSLLKHERTPAVPAFENASELRGAASSVVSWAA